MAKLPSRVSLDVLITGGGRMVPLVAAFQRALRELRLAGSVHVADVSTLSPMLHAADRAHLAPLPTDPRYVEHIAGICEREGIGLVVPTVDEELPLYSEARDRFARLGVAVAVSNSFVTSLCNDKYAACAYLADQGIAAAASWLPETLPADPALPLFLKPRFGQGSAGAFAARNRRELDFFLEYVGSPVIQEYLDGPEYAIDLCCDLDGRPLSVVPRERAAVRAGVPDRGRTSRDPGLITPDLWMTGYDTAIFADAVRLGALGEQARACRRIVDVA